VTAPGPASAGSSLAARRSRASLLLAVPTSVLLLSAAWLALDVVAGPDALGLAALMPLGVPVGDGVSAAVGAMTALLLAIGLTRHKTWLAALAATVLTAGALSLGVTRGAALSGIVDLLALLSLLVAWRDLVAGTGRRGLAFAGVFIAVGVLLVLRGIASPGSGDPGTADDAMLSWLSLSAGAAGGLPAAAALLLASACLLQALPDGRTGGELARAHQALLRLGRGSLFPYQLRAPASPVTDTAGEAALAYARAGRAAVVLGDPAGESAAADRCFVTWVDAATRRDWSPVVYQASEAARDRLVAQGWHGLLVGMEAIIDPSAFRLGTPQLANVRHTVTRSRKGGVSVAWSVHGLPDSPDPARLATGLSAIDATWRRSAGPQMGFTVGHFDGAHLGDAGVAAATDEHGDPVAFVVLHPTGADGSWALDLMRRLPGSVPGAVEACLVAAIEGLGALGVRQLSLGLAPLHGLDPAEGPRSQRWLARAAVTLRPFYDYPGLAFYKSKFDPQWVPRYLLVRDHGDLLPASMALLRLHLGGSWSRVMRSLLADAMPGRGS
jgi:lysylphosphatidylglycerol synthetase-like protein (DUF2156 family)